MLLLLVPFITAESCSSARGINGQKASGINAVTPPPTNNQKNTLKTIPPKEVIPINQDNTKTEVIPKGTQNNSETQSDMTDTQKQSSRKSDQPTGLSTTDSSNDEEEEEDGDHNNDLNGATGEKKKNKEDKGGIKKMFIDLFKKKKKKE